jgi:single-stranded-DNA-specific exonuclease
VRPVAPGDPRRRRACRRSDGVASAETWSRRLAPRIVIAANDGYVAGRVNFAVRGGTASLPALLRAALPDVGGEYAHGHDRASGGSIAPGDFERLLAALGLAG